MKLNTSLDPEAYGYHLVQIAINVHEKGYVNDPDDPGKETIWGVTIAVARADGYKGPMRDMPQATAIGILYRQFFVKFGGFALAQAGMKRLAYLVFDWSVNSGESAPAFALQRVLNCLNLNGKRYADIGEDGDIGPATIAAIQACAKSIPDAEELLCYLMNCERGVFWMELTRKRPVMEKFMLGWARRGDDMVDATNNVNQ